MDILSELTGCNKDAIEKQTRLKKAKSDFGFFCRYYLGDYFFSASAEYQRILYDVADTQSLHTDTAEKLKPFVHTKYQSLLQPTEYLAGAMFIEPREHGKTVRWSFAYPLWCVLANKKRYVLLIGASANSAKENLSNIKIELEENERIFADFGNMQGATWKDDRIELTNGTCLQSKGSGASMRGTRFRQYRPDLIVLDDVLKDDEINSRTMRDKIYRWLKRVVFNLGKTSFIIWVNTIFHNDDPISRLCAELALGNLPRWIAVRLSCLKEDGEPLWSEYWNKEDFAEKKKTLGFSAFSTEYMNEPLSDEERIIKREWIDDHRYTVHELPSGNKLRYVLGVDPATGAHDRTAEVPLAVDKTTGVMYVLSPWAKTCSETETVEHLITLHTIYRFECIGWEDVVFSGIYGNYVQRLAAERGVYLPIKKLKVGSQSKESRIRSISSLLENGIIRFPENSARELETELLEFPRGAFDDMCDALVHAVTAAERGDKQFAVGRCADMSSRSVSGRILSKIRGLR